MKNRLPAALRRILFILPYIFFQSVFAQNSTGTFICFSDLHFNPFHNPALVDTLVKSPFERWNGIFKELDKTAPGKYGEDSDYSLFNSMLAGLDSTDKDPDFIIYTGDFLAHNFPEEYRSITKDTAKSSSEAFILKTVEFIVSKIAGNFPNTPVYFALGNNDSFTGDYNSVWKGKFFKQTATVFSNNFINNKESRQKFISEYPVSGCYNIPVGAFENKVEIISLNTNFLSAKCPPDQSAYGKKVLIWLAKKLEDAKIKNEKVWLINHMPPGIDVYTTLKHQAGGQPIREAREFLKENYNSKFLELIEKYKDVITANFSGHIHTDDFRLYKDKSGSAYAFTHIIPSVSPVFGNNPSFQIFSYEAKSFSLLDYKTYALDLTGDKPVWKYEYSFNDAYKQNGINAHSLNELHSEIRNNAAVRNNYVLYYTGSSKLVSIAGDWVGYWCGISNLTKDDFVRKYNKLKHGK